ncbi:MAG: ABC transporter [Bacteroidetes bacterium]|nr:MAG: ABC transporter [Bacteroidota bacterium]
MKNIEEFRVCEVNSRCRFEGMMWLRLLRESLSFAWSAIVVNKLRTFLSLLGVMVGIFVISAIFAVVDTMEEDLMDSFSMLDDDVLFVGKWPWSMGGDYPWWKYVQRREPSLRDSEELADRLTLASDVAFQMKGMYSIESGDNSYPNAPVVAVSDTYPGVISLDFATGRFFNGSESAAGRPVAVIGNEIAMSLFGTDEVLGKKIKVKGQKLEIIGTFTQQGASIVSTGFDEIVMVPATFAPRIFDVHNLEGASIMVKAKEGVEMAVLKDEIIQQFRGVRRVRPGNENDFSINQVDMLTGIISSIFTQVELGGWFIAIFAILVGCFSIANIMFVSVRERTKIIGVQKALGAKSSFILIQFLFEAIVLCVFGAVLALLAIELMMFLVNISDIGMTLRISLSRVGMAISIAVVSGLLAGIAPALSAARMPPVDAMRSF